jgi:hypothetical protein
MWGWGSGEPARTLKHTFVGGGREQGRETSRVGDSCPPPTPSLVDPAFCAASRAVNEGVEGSRATPGGRPPHPFGTSEFAIFGRARSVHSISVFIHQLCLPIRDTWARTENLRSPRRTRLRMVMDGIEGGRAGYISRGASPASFDPFLNGSARVGPRRPRWPKSTH